MGPNLAHHGTSERARDGVGKDRDGDKNESTWSQLSDKISLLLQEDSLNFSWLTCHQPWMLLLLPHLLGLSRFNHGSPFRGALTTLLSQRLQCSELLLLPTPTPFLPFRLGTAQEGPAQGRALQAPKASLSWDKILPS